jgi:hypothetical protein
MAEQVQIVLFERQYMQMYPQQLEAASAVE